MERKETFGGRIGLEGGRCKVDQNLGGPTSYSIQSPIRILDREAKVSALVDESLMWWNTSMIHSIFTEEDAVSICSMAICPQRQQDKLVWVGTKNGIFSVKSAYHLAKEKNDGLLGELFDC